MALNVLDLSGYQAGISADVIGQSQELVIVKLTEGTDVSNNDWARQAQAALDQGKFVGLYHFPRFGESSEQAQAFVNASSGMWDRTRVIPILDWEDSPYTRGILDYPDFARDWLSQVGQLTGATPWIYGGPGTMARDDHAALKQWPLWLAAYPSGDVQNGWGPVLGATLEWARDTMGGGLPGWSIVGWQYTGTGRLSGYGGDLDMSEFYVSRDELAGYANGTGSGGGGGGSSAASMEPAIGWMNDRAGRVTYSMDYRNGPNSYDCSSSVYYALQAAGINPSGKVGNTETMFQDLPSWGFYELPKDGNGDIAFQRGDVFIWGAPGQSSGSGGHTGIFVDSANIIHCNYGYNGITVNDYNTIWEANRRMPETGYRYRGSGSGGNSPGKDWFDMATQKDLEIAVDTVFHRNDGFIRECVHDVLHKEQFRREGDINGKPLGGTTSFALETQYAAQNFGRLKADVLWAQKQIAEQAEEQKELEKKIDTLIELLKKNGVQA